MKKWTELRKELEQKHKGLTRSKLDRMLARLTRDKKLDPQQQDQASRARVLSDNDVATLTAAAADLEQHPREVPQQFRRKTETGSAGGDGNNDTGDEGDDPNLTVEQLARSEGPKNTRKSLSDKKPKAKRREEEDDDGDDDEDEEPKKGKLGKWLLIGAGVLLAVGAIAFIMRRRRAAAGGGGAAMPADPAAVQPEPVDPLNLTEEERRGYNHLLG